MDSLTQIVLGASVGEVVLGKKIGNKAMFWGAVAGTIPDLDVLANPFLDTLGEMSFHRSLTHSFLFCLLASPALGWLFKNKFFQNSEVTQREWSWLFFWGFLTHIALDCFTTWGTQIFFPFSRHAVAFHSIFVIDPLYTIPLMGFLIVAMFYKKGTFNRGMFNGLGLVVSSMYLFVALVNKGIADKVFEENFERQGITQVQEYISKPTPFNSILWGITAKAKDGFYLGYHSLFDEDHNVTYQFVRHNQDLLQNLQPTPDLQRLIEITQGYFTVEKAPEEGYYINDLRFGQFNGWLSSGEKPEYVFIYHITEDEETGEQTFGQKEFRFIPNSQYVSDFLTRLFGEE